MSLVEIVKYFMTKHSKTESSDFEQFYEVIGSMDDEDCTPRSPREQALRVYRVSLKTIRNDRVLKILMRLQDATELLEKAFC